jgi:hypothetical protein
MQMNQSAAFEQRALLTLPGKDAFAVADAFKVGSKIGGRTLSVISWNFSRHFLGVVEHHVLETQIIAWTLLYTADDKWILETLDGQQGGGACRLANIYSLMALGEKASNHLDGQSNFAYVRSPVDRRLWAVHWLVNSTGEWIIGSAQVPHPEVGWRVGSRLFTSQNVHVLSHKHQVRHH